MTASPAPEVVDVTEAFRAAQKRLRLKAAEHDARIPDPESDKKVNDRIKQLQIDAKARERVAAEMADAAFKVPDAPTSLAEELEKLDEPLVSRVEGLSYVGSRVLLAGRAKAGKTTLEINLAKSLADGTPFLGSISVLPPEGNIGIVNYEMSKSQMNGWFRSAGIRHPDRIVPLHLTGQPMALVSPRVQQLFIEWAREREVEVLIMDPWAKIMVDCGSENSNDDVNNVTAILDYIREEAGIKDLFVIAHMGHAEHEDGMERARGASALMGWPDALWNLNRSGDIRLLAAEGRDVQFASAELDFHSATHTMSLTGRIATKGTINTKKAADEVVAIVTSLPGLSTADLKSKITATNNSGERTSAIKEAINSGRIHRVDGKGTSKLHYPGPGSAGGVDPSDPGIQGFLNGVATGA